MSSKETKKVNTSNEKNDNNNNNISRSSATTSKPIFVQWALANEQFDSQAATSNQLLQEIKDRGLPKNIDFFSECARQGDLQPNV